MPSPIVPADIEETIPQPTGSICSKLDALWSLANKLLTWWEWAWNADGTATDELIEQFVSPGLVMFWPVTTSPPDGWLACNGSNVSRTDYAELFARIGVTFGVGDGSTTFQLPDYRDRFLIGASGTKAAGTTGGSATATIGMANLPEEIPPTLSELDKFVISEGSTAGTATTLSSGGSSMRVATPEEVFDDLGDGDEFSVLNPYAAGVWVIKT
jgi:microcystin-dependent protein